MPRLMGWFFALLIAACSFTYLAPDCQAQSPSAQLSGNWRTASLPFRAIEVASNSNALWVCGLDEMIAKSLDGGQTWQIKHQKKDGEVLLYIAFIRQDLGYASGTNGLLLWTKDGGETWSESHSGSLAVSRISFSDHKNGLRQIGSAVEITHDGGGNWTPISAYQSDGEVANFKTVAALATLDDKRAAILFRAGPDSSHALVATKDGGTSWTRTEIPNAQVWSLVVHNAEFWASAMR